MKISAVVAMDEKRGIGKDNMVPWHIREDLIRLKKLTIGHVTILGRTTYESMLAYYEKSGKPTMSQRTHIVVTRDAEYKVDKDKGFTALSVEDAIGQAQEIEKKRISENKETPESSPIVDAGQSSMTYDGGEIFVIGGGQIFQQAMPHLTRLYLTVVHEDFACDTIFPDYSDFTKVIEKEEHLDNDPAYTFLTLER